MLECSHIAFSSSGLCSDAFILHISLPLFVCSLFMVFYLLVNKLLCYMNGKDWLTDKGLRWADSAAGSFNKALPKQFMPQQEQP